MSLRVAAMAAVLGGLAQGVLALDGGLPQSSCPVGPDKKTAVTPVPGRAVYCALDLGSKNAKLSVVSMEPGRPATVRDERQCKRALGFGALVFDSKTSTRKPLPAAAVDSLVETVLEYQAICRLDGGTLVGAAASQWARDATNVEDVRATVKAKTGLEVEVLTPKREAEYGYTAASLGRPGRVVLDPGSNSFETAWRAKGSPSVSSVTIEYGYVRASVGDFESAPDYATARRNYAEKARARIGADLGRLTPPMDLAGLRKLVADGALDPEILTFGQDGAIAPPVRGLLREGDGWISEAKPYEAVLARQAPKTHPDFGLMITDPITATEIQAYLSGIRPADFKTLSSDPVKSLYGQRALVIPALVDLLLTELGAKRLVMLPQELSTGVILARIAQ